MNTAASLLGLRELRSISRFASEFSIDLLDIVIDVFSRSASTETQYEDLMICTRKKMSIGELASTYKHRLNNVHHFIVLVYIIY